MKLKSTYISDFKTGDKVYFKEDKARGIIGDIYVDDEDGVVVICVWCADKNWTELDYGCAYTLSGALKELKRKIA